MTVTDTFRGNVSACDSIGAFWPATDTNHPCQVQAPRHALPGEFLMNLAANFMSLNLVHILVTSILVNQHSEPAYYPNSFTRVFRHVVRSVKSCTKICTFTLLYSSTDASCVCWFVQPACPFGRKNIPPGILSLQFVSWLMSCKTTASRTYATEFHNLHEDFSSRRKCFRSTCTQHAWLTDCRLHTTSCWH